MFVIWPRARARACRLRAAARAGCRACRDDLDDRLAALDVAFAVVEDPVPRERGRVELRVVKVEREEIARLEILDLRAILAVTGASRRGRRRRAGEREGRDQTDCARRERDG
jgi:hypothetical protein